MSLSETFRKSAAWSANALGSPWLFIANVILILVWFGSGPLFHFSDTWQLIVNTATTVFTYLAVFLIQNTQNRDAKAVHLKLDELISSVEGARNRMVDLQHMTDAELEQLQRQFRRLQTRAREHDGEATRAIAGEPDDGDENETPRASAGSRRFMRRRSRRSRRRSNTGL